MDSDAGRQSGKAKENRYYGKKSVEESQGETFSDFSLPISIFLHPVQISPTMSSRMLRVIVCVSGVPGAVYLQDLVPFAYTCSLPNLEDKYYSYEKPF